MVDADVDLVFLGESTTKPVISDNCWSNQLLKLNQNSLWVDLKADRSCTLPLHVLPFNAKSIGCLNPVPHMPILGSSNSEANKDMIKIARYIIF